MLRSRTDRSFLYRQQIILINSKFIECAYLSRLVLGSGEEVGAVGRELDVVDLVVELVDLDVGQLVTGLDR